jgi:hypothetical protein
MRAICQTPFSAFALGSYAWPARMISPFCRLEVKPKLAALSLLITNLPTIAVLPLEKSLQQLETFPTRS